jgi:vacuolar-type H+-ATPase subunit F/Vma7
MSAFAYVGAAEDAAGLRLAGVRCWSAHGDGTGAEAFRAALASGAEVVFLTAAIAEALPRAELDAARAGGRPLGVLLPEPGRPLSRLDPAERVRAQLGLDT